MTSNQLSALLVEALQLLERLATNPHDPAAVQAVGELNKRACGALASEGGQPGAGAGPIKSSVAVKHWRGYGETASGTLATHQIDIEDQRSINGQVYLTVGAAEGKLDDMITVVAEVNTNPETGKDAVPCVHVSFDPDAMAFSLFKVGDKMLLRPERDVSLTRTEVAGLDMFLVE